MSIHYAKNTVAPQKFTPQPHDCFTKKSLKEEKIFIDLLKAYLEPAIYNQLDFNTLEVVDPNLEKSNLRTLSCDIIYKCDIKTQKGRRTCIFICEHQSSAHPLMHLRFVEYNSRVLRHYLDLKTNQLPQIYNLCIYHGKASPYPYPTNIRDDFPLPELAQLDCAFRMIDVTEESIETLKQRGVAALLLVLLKIARSENILEVLKNLAEADILTYVIAHTRSDYLDSALTYAIQCEENDQSADELINIFINALPQQREKIMTFAQQLENRGLNKGIAEGTYRTNKQNAQKMLLRGLSPQIIAEITGLSLDEIKSLAN